MILSPPFLPDPTAEEAAVEQAMQGGDAGSGGFPVSHDLNWHGGVHLTAPSDGSGAPAPARAIADGTVVFVRQPTPKNDDPEHPLNYRDGWTDDGCVVLRHETAIGASASTPTTVVFFSIWMHLQAIGPTVQSQKRLYRKEVVGTPGRIYGVAGRVHFEIICDDANIARLAGRTDPFLPVDHDGRTDVIFGGIWFFLPVQTPFFAARPGGPHATLPLVAFTNSEGMFVRVRFDGGDAFVQAFHLDGRPIEGVAERPDAGAEYHLSHTASTQYPHSPSAGYDLLRFGRVLGPEPLVPPTAPNWRQIDYPGGSGWVDLNATNVRRFSDADLPHWASQSWVLVDGSSGADSRCNEPAVLELLDKNQDWKLPPAEVVASLKDPAVQARLAGKICKFHTEWQAESIPDRYGWLTKEYVRDGKAWKTRMDAKGFARFQAHARALSFWAAANLGIDPVHWHFHPTSFVRHFKRCLWLSADELAQCIPTWVWALSRTQFVHVHVANWSMARARAETWAVDFNVATRRYHQAATPRRLTQFIAQISAETGWFAAVKEGGGEQAVYALYYGRGLIQLTGTAKATGVVPGNYAAYGNFRRFSVNHPNPAAPFAALGWNPNDLIATSNTHFNGANCADSAGYYWVSITADSVNGLQTSDQGTGVAGVVAASKATNGNVPVENVNGLDARVESFTYLKYQLLDLLRPGPTEHVRFDWRSDTKTQPLFHPDGTPVLDSHGNQRRGYVRTTHEIDVPLAHQQP